jgi:hypothetical protein
MGNVNDQQIQLPIHTVYIYRMSYGMVCPRPSPIERRAGILGHGVQNSGNKRQVRRWRDALTHARPRATATFIPNFSETRSVAFTLAHCLGMEQLRVEERVRQRTLAACDACRVRKVKVCSERKIIGWKIDDSSASFRATNENAQSALSSKSSAQPFDQGRKEGQKIGMCRHCARSLMATWLTQATKRSTI